MRETYDLDTYDPERTPAFWFLLLEKARDDGRFADADRFLHELRELGVKVEWKKPRQRKAVPDAR